MTKLSRLTGALAVLLASSAFAPAFADADAALAELQNTVLSKGPNGEEPTPASDLSLSDEELAKIKDMNATAAIVMHYGGNDWSRAQIDGLKDAVRQDGHQGDRRHRCRLQAGEAGRRHRDGHGAEARASSSRSRPIRPPPPAPTRRRPTPGVKIVFMDNVPPGLTAGKDYVSVVSADNYGNGVASAHLMAKALGGKGEIGLVFHAADFFVTRQRYDAFKADDRRRLSRTSRSSPSRASAGRISPAMPRRRPPPC